MAVIPALGRLWQDRRWVVQGQLGLHNFASKIKPNQTNPKHKIIKTTELMGREKGRGDRQQTWWNRAQLAAHPRSLQILWTLCLEIFMMKGSVNSPGEFSSGWVIIQLINKQAEDPDTFKGHQAEKNSDMYLVHTLNTKVGFTFTEDKILMHVTTKENSGKCVKYQKNKNQ